MDITNEAFREREDRMSAEIQTIWQAAFDEVRLVVDEYKDFDAIEQLAEMDGAVKQIIAEAKLATATYMDGEIEPLIDDITKENEDYTRSQVSTAFTDVADEIMEAVLQDFANSLDRLEGTAQAVASRYSEELRNAHTQVLIESLANRESWRQRSERLEAAIRKGDIEIPEGWKGTVESYADVAARASFANAARNASMASAADLGIEIFQVSLHGAIDGCGAFEGRLVSLSGKGEGVVMSVAELQAMAPLIYHPQCSHRLMPYMSKYATDKQKAALRYAGENPLPDVSSIEEMQREAQRLRYKQNKEKKPLMEEARRSKLKERLAA